MNIHQKITVAVLDILILVELCASIYIANLYPESFTPAFFKSFFSMLLPTLVVATIVVKRLRSPQIETVR